MTDNQFQNSIYLKKAGFTLAEVLVTLAIIGVVAALTIPSLVTKVQEAQYKTAFKKIYSSLSSATNRIIEENPTFQSQLTDHDKIRNEYGKYVNFIKTCNSYTPMADICWTSAGVKYLNGTGGGGAFSLDQQSMAVTSDGATFSFSLQSGVCQGTIPCIGSILIDVNGFKPPNTRGRDVFSVYMTPTRLIPATPDGFYGCDLNSDYGRIYLGEACASLVLSNTDYRIK